MYAYKIRNLIISVGLAGIACLAPAAPARAQSPEPSTAPTSPSQAGNYTVTSSIEFGYRFASVNGDTDKYRSDLNYRAGARLFDSSFLIENNGDSHSVIDNALITSSGWGADPSGSTMVKMNKTGIYKFDASVRKVVYYNNLSNFATNWSQQFPTGSEHQSNTRHHFGDFDLTLFPESDKFRFRLGYGFNNTEGPGAYTIRWPSFASTTFTTRGDEFQVSSDIKNRSHDFRLGTEGNFLGFNWGVNYGHRAFRDHLKYTIDSFNPGNNPLANTASINSFYREFPTKGATDYVSGTLQRTFARKLDFTGRLIYSDSRTDFTQSEAGSGLSSFSSSSVPQIAIDLDRAVVTGTSKRNQTRADVGLTYRVTDSIRISDTFNFDQFAITGENLFLEYLMSHTTAGGTRPNDFSSNTSWRLTNYQRYTNLIEADFQINRMFAFNFGYRYGHRMEDLAALDRNVVNGVVGLNEAEEFKNSTNAVIGGAKIQPTHNWAIYADFEHGKVDTPFTRLSNGKFTNYRIRTKVSLKDFGLSVSYISKDNDIPGLSNCGCTIPETDTIARSKNHVFNASVDWTPIPALTFNSGFTYNHMDSVTDIIVPVGAPVVSTTTWFLGTSKYFTRDKYFNFDITARPTNRISFFISYRISDDPGQGDLVATRPQDIYSSYPMRFQTPEARFTIKLRRNMDWNVGYQYYSYRETPIQNPLTYIVITGQPNVNQVYPAQNYTAHLPYTSLRIYFGTAKDR